MKRSTGTLPILVFSLWVLCTWLVAGASEINLKRHYWPFFSSEYRLDSSQNFCTLKSGSYENLGYTFRLEHPLYRKKCELNGFYDCNVLQFDLEARSFLCDGTKVSPEGIPLNESSERRDLALLRFGSQIEVDYCAQAYEANDKQLRLWLNENEIRIGADRSTSNFFHECSVTGDVSESGQVCSNVFFTRLGAVCILGSDSRLLRFQRKVSISDQVEGVINHYRPENYDFSLRCDSRRMWTHWSATEDANLSEEIVVHPRGYISEIITQMSGSSYSHRFDSQGHYFEVLNLDSLVEAPVPQQTTWQYYQPAIVKNKKFQHPYFWVNYLGTLRECCSDLRCKQDMKEPSFLRNRRPLRFSSK